MNIYFENGQLKLKYYEQYHDQWVGMTSREVEKTFTPQEALQILDFLKGREGAIREFISANKASKIAQLEKEKEVLDARLHQLKNGVY